MARLTGRLPARRPRGVPADRAALLIGLRDGTASMADFDRTDVGQVRAVAYVAAVLVAHTGVGAER